MRNPTPEQIEHALWIHCSVLEKSDGRTKGRSAAVGRTQTRYMEEKMNSPTIRLKSIILMA
jgi:hypothetical protein